MAKLHMRVSVEMDVPDNLFMKVVERSLSGSDGRNILCDVEYYMLPAEIKAMVDTKSFETCDWDDGGYIPETWIGYDAEDSGLYEVSEHGVIRKENV